MHRSLIIAKILPDAQDDVAAIFAESDRTELPRIAGVRRRSLYRLGEVYAHLLETEAPGADAVARATAHPEFRRVSDELSRFVSPYLPSWRGPEDARATLFYDWTPDR
jgi:cyclase